MPLNINTLGQEGEGYFTPYKSYIALLSQEGTNPPVPNILNNTLDGVPEWGREGVGDYVLNLEGAFPLNKTFIIIGEDAQGGSGTIEIRAINYNMPDTIEIQVRNGDLLLDDTMVTRLLEIRVYP